MFETGTPALFQFHKVRLKDGDLNFQNADTVLFQFHKVRLKEGARLAVRQDDPISIP